MPTLQELYDEAGRPGARAFRTYARKKGENITSAEAQEFVRKQAQGQVFQARLPSDGKVTSSRENMRWQADLIVFARRASSQAEGAFKYALTVIDIFTRKGYVEMMKDNKDINTKEAMRKIVVAAGAAPHEISVDLGNEFGPSWQAYMQDQGAVVRKKHKEDTNAIAAVDRMQQSLKGILKSIQGADGWAKHLKRAMSLYNDREHSGLYGAAPDDVGQNKELQYRLEVEAGEKVQHNNQRWREKAGKLQDNGGFRVPMPKNTWPRIDQPRFEGKVHKAAALKGANIEDTEGNSFPVRQVMAVPKDSEDVELNDELLPGSGKRLKQKEFLKPFAEKLKQQLSRQPTGELSFAAVRIFLNKQAHFNDTADLYKLPVGPQGRHNKFLRLFGFQIIGSGPGMSVRRPAGASGSSQLPRGRPVEAVDLMPRMPRRGLPAATAITWTPDNQYRGGTLAYSRYELYKGASTVGESRALGATPQDLKAGISKGYAQL